MHTAEDYRAELNLLQENVKLAEQHEAAQAATTAALRAEVEQLRVDAERYRWLRDVEEGSDAWNAASYIIECPTNEWDAAIDAARKGDK